MLERMNKYWIGIGVLLAVMLAFWVISVRTARAPTGPASFEAHLEQEISGLDVQIIPIKVLEDSRCPIDVTCIQAGTVRVHARLTSGLGNAVQEFTLGQPVTTEAEIVTLAAVSPSPKAGVNIADGDYVFQFQITKR